jgi:hypothetical protein
MVVSRTARGTFAVRQLAGGKEVFRGKLSAAAADENSGDEVRVADFSPLRQRGTFYLDVPGTGASWPFVISADAYSRPFYLAMRSFYGQRCGTAVDLGPEFPGYAHAVCQDPLFIDFLLGYMEQEGSPTLPEVPGVDLDAYRHQLIERFANPEVRDTLARLCAESSDRIPKWLVPVINRNLETGGEIDRSALVVAAWARYAEGVDEQGAPIEIVDRIKDRVMAAAARQGEDALAFIRDRDLFGALADDARFAEAYAAALDSLHTRGARATLEARRGLDARG